MLAVFVLQKQSGRIEGKPIFRLPNVAKETGGTQLVLYYDKICELTSTD